MKLYQILSDGIYWNPLPPPIHPPHKSIKEPRSLCVVARRPRVDTDLGITQQSRVPLLSGISREYPSKDILVISQFYHIKYKLHFQSNNIIKITIHNNFIHVITTVFMRG